MNFERIRQTRIPDLAPVYGGARGRTMSSRHQAYAWKALQEAGVRTIIDLRLTDHTDRLPVLCNEYGMKYFHYPVDSSAETIEQMINRFDEFCRIMDEGDFYIACAMGLHRTDIAVSAYWLFHGADMGLPPPDIHGYRSADGHTLDKLNRILNTMSATWTERNGTAPCPPLVLKERKYIISKQAQL